MVGFYISPEVASRSVNFNNSSTEDVKNYKQNDKSKFGFGAGFILELKLPYNYFIRTGISYCNVGERNTSEYTISKMDTTYNPNNSLKVTKPHGTVSWVTGDTAIVIIGSTVNTFPGQKDGVSAISEIKRSVLNFTSTVQNNYHYLGVPLVFGMRLGRSRLHAGMYSGVIAMCLFRQTEQYIPFITILKALKNTDNLTVNYQGSRLCIGVELILNISWYQTGA